MPGSNSSDILASNHSDCFSLQLISPSVGVSEPLFFRLASGTTVKQLKEKIRGALPMRPPNDHQRLIHQGRLLARDAETMLEIFGPDRINSLDIQTLHLVLRPTTSELTASPTRPVLPNRLGNAFNPSPLGSLRSEPPPPFQVSPDPRYENGDIERERTQQERTAAQHSENADAGTIRFPGIPAYSTVPSPSFIGPTSSQSGNNQQSSHVPQSAVRYSPHANRSPELMAQQVNETGALSDPYRHNRQSSQALSLEALQSQMIAQEVEREQERILSEHLAQRLPTHHTPGGPPQPIPGHTFHELIAQNQRDRATMGMHGAQHGNIGNHHLPNSPLVRVPQDFRQQYLPHQTRIRTHDMAGPNGERWQVTINETTTTHYVSRPHNNQTSPIVGDPMAREVQHLVHNMIRQGNGTPSLAQATQLPADSQPVAPQPTTGTITAASRPASAPPSSTSNRVSNPVANSQVVSGQSAHREVAGVNSPLLNGPQVYILSSPTGPQALLVKPAENGLEVFFTPQQRSTGFSHTESQQRQDGLLPNTQSATERRQRREARAQRQARHQDGPNVGPALPARPGNPQAGRVAIQLWPHIWLMIRLIVFVWFFATGDNRSWYQFITVTGLAVVVFFASTGMFNGIADQVWAPFRRHLEGLVPLAAPNIANRAIPNNDRAPPNNANANAIAPVQNIEAPNNDGGVPDSATADPHPAEAAARLIEQRRQQNESWLWMQIRRAEHALILFLASLIPGVGERHIAARAAEENLLLEAERLRREVGAAAERVVAVEEQLRAAMGEMVNVAAGVAALNTPGAGDGQTAEEGAVQTRERTDIDGGGNDENAGLENSNGASQAREEIPGQPLLEV